MKLDRRTLLISGGVGVGLIVGYAMWPRGLDSELPVGKDESAFGNFIKIGRDGRIIVAVPQVETGQGIWTALPQVVADELGAAWETVAVEPAPPGPAYANRIVSEEGWGAPGLRITAGATSVRAFEQPMREAAAVARMMLIGAAADRWNVDPAECEAADGIVLNGGNSFTFAELAEESAGRSPPRVPRLRQDSKGRLMGQPLQRLDARAKSSGSWRFGGDVRLPGMLFASARLAPPDGKLAGFSRGAVKSIAGVRHLIARDKWVAVVADSWWAAEQAIKAADPRFTATAAPDSAGLRELYARALDSGSQTVFSHGDYGAAVRGLRPLTASYWVAPSLHLGLDPLTATARINGDHLEVWAPTLAPDAAKARAEKAAAGHRVTFYPMPVGEPAGRALESDAIPVAVELARSTGRPVQLVLSQSASQNHDHPSGGALARMFALPTPSGMPAAWKMHFAAGNGFGAALNALGGDSPPTSLGAVDIVGAVPPYAIPHMTIDGSYAQLPFEAGYMRGSPQREFCFSTESFVDELARRVGLEPLAFRMSMLGGNGRLARCLQAAARLAQWDGGGAGSTMGLAGCSAFGSHIGLVAMASIGPDQRIKTDRLVAAVDCGRVINSGLVRQQVEGAMLWALAQATVPAPEWVAGMPRARPFAGMDLPRIGGTPDVVVHIIPSSEAPGGANGLGAPVVAPAIANAIFAGTGRRLRDLPFDPMSAA